MCRYTAGDRGRVPMRERYTYEIATDERDGEWKRVIRREDTFSRDPASIVRALLENWVIEHPDELSGGERIHITHPRRRIVAEPVGARVRVRLYSGSLHQHAPEPIGVGFLGHDARDFAGPDRGETADRLRKLGKSVGKAAKDRRVGAGAAAAATLILGYAASRQLRRRKGPPPSA